MDGSGRVGELGLAIAVTAVIVMMVVPLTPWLIDLLIGFNFCISLLLLSLALFIRKPLAFTTFPTLILISTLYRLALNISSTRLILLRADAGNIIRGFGGYVVGGDILIGAVIFGILALVLFLVITKGAERVAEVAARFSLDALPGFQLAIDSDLRQGAVSPLEASRRRDDLERKSRYFGSLDGAMKFVRGDALAALCIIFVNILGGLAVGMIRHGMSAGRAIDVYGRLTVGDGLVSMIPALLVSTAAGILVTRVGQDDAEARLGQQVGRQLIEEPRALGAAAVILFALASVNGLPAWPFLITGVAVGALAAVRLLRERRAGVHQEGSLEAIPVAGIEGVPAVVELGSDLFEVLTSAARSRRVLERDLARGVKEGLGIPIRTVHIMERTEAPSGEARLRIKGMVRRRAVLEGEEAKRPDPLIARIEAWLRGTAGYLIGMDETQALVDMVAATRPVLVRETVPRIVSLPELATLLRGLVQDGIRVDLLPEILESISKGRKDAPPAERMEHVRVGLSAEITSTLLRGGNDLCVILFSPEIESVLEAGLTATSDGTTVSLPEGDISRIVEACKEAAKGLERPILVTSPHLRKPVADLLAVELPRFAVIKGSDIEPHIPVTVVSTASV